MTAFYLGLLFLTIGFILFFELAEGRWAKRAFWLLAFSGCTSLLLMIVAHINRTFGILTWP